MKDQIRIDTDVCEALADSMKSLKLDVQSCANELARIHMTRSSGAALDLSVNVRLSTTGGRMTGGDAASCVAMLGRLTSGVSDYAGELVSALRQIQDLFESGEQNIEQSAALAIMTAAPYSQGHGGSASADANEISFHTFLKGAIKPLPGGLPGIIESWDMNGGYGQILDGTQIGWLSQDGSTKFSGPNAKFTSKKFKHGKEAGMQWNFGDEDGAYRNAEDANMFDRRLDLALIKAETGFASSIWETDGRVSGDRGTAGYNLGLFNGNANASMSGGLWSTGENGETYFAPGIAAEAGTSFSVLDISADVGYEIMDGLDVGVEGKISALSAGANAEVQFGIVDNQFQAYAGFSAQANLAEASGSMTVDAGGIKGSIGGAVNVGVGAHANFGYKDGVIKIDIGAAVGIGASFNCTLDVSGMVQNIGNGIAGIANSIYNWL